MNCHLQKTDSVSNCCPTNMKWVASIYHHFNDVPSSTSFLPGILARGCFSRYDQVLATFLQGGKQTSKSIDSVYSFKI